MVSEPSSIVASRTVLDELPPTRGAIFQLLKLEGFASINRIAEVLGISHEAARKQVVDLQRNGWIASDCGPEEAREAVPGRPPVRYCLTMAADQFFPKQYPELGIALLDSLAAEDMLIPALASITDQRVAAHEPGVRARPLKQRMNALRSLYRDGDPHTEVKRRGADYVLIERNCPYLDVAMERPEICSTTVSALRRLTGCEVVRERRFQDGDGRCEFHVRTATASPENERRPFELEPPRNS